MSGVVTAVVGGSAAVLGAGATYYAADRAAKAQESAAEAGIAESQRRFEAMQRLFQPYIQAGATGLEGYQNLIGGRGAIAQDIAIQEIANSPEVLALTRQGEEGILQNAAATGGLRGGNTQGALADLRSRLLAGAVANRQGQFLNLAQLGQASAAGLGAGGMATGQNIAGLLGQAGAAEAGGWMALAGSLNNNLFNPLAGGAALALGNRIGAPATTPGGSLNVVGAATPQSIFGERSLL